MFYLLVSCSSVSLNSFTLQRTPLQLQEGLTLNTVCIWTNSNVKKAAELQSRVELEKEQEDKRQLPLRQLAEEDKAEQEQKREHDTAKELINEASKKMSAAIETKNMQMLKAEVKSCRKHHRNLTRLVLNKKISENNSMTLIRKKLYLLSKEEDLNCVCILVSLFLCIAYLCSIHL